MLKLKYRYILIALCVLISPVIAMLLITYAVKYGTIVVDKLCLANNWDIQLLFITLDTALSIGEFINYYFIILGIEITAIFSYALWVTSIKSNELAEAINNKEDNRDNEKIKESALIIYYDLLSKINFLKGQYVQHILNKDIESDTKMSVSNDWIKNVVNLKNALSKNELDSLFDLYENFSLIEQLQKDVCKEGLIKKEILSLSEKLFLFELRDYLWMDFSNKIDCIIKNKYYIVLRKTEILSNSESILDVHLETEEKLILKQGNKNVKLEGEIVNGMLKSGINSYRDDASQLVYVFMYQNNKVIEGKFVNKINNTREVIFDCKINEDNTRTNGYVVEFYDSCRVKYRGNIKEMKYHDEGTLYHDRDNEPTKYKGIWHHGSKVKGEMFGSGIDTITYFKGEFKNNRPWSGEIKTSDTYLFHDAYGFCGTIKEGKLVDGKGYTLNKVIVDEDYLDKHPEEQRFYRQDIPEEDYYYEQDIPDDVKEAWIEENERFQNQNERDNLQETCIEVYELIQSQWNNEELIVAEDDMMNKKYFGMGIKE